MAHSDEKPSGGNLGGTGKVNYATGAVSLTFATAPANLQAITCSYYREDPTTDGRSTSTPHQLARGGGGEMTGNPFDVTFEIYTDISRTLVRALRHRPSAMPR